jgi:hypothetical protein
MLRNPIYNGWVRRHRRGPDEQLLPAAWRDHPPVDDALWEHVQHVRADRYTGGGRSTKRHVHMLASRVYCVCGVRIRSEGTTKKRRWVQRRYRHPDRCSSWASSTKMAHHFEGPISAQVEQMRLGDSLMFKLRTLAATSSPGPDATSLRRRRIERELGALGQRHATRSMATDACLVKHERLTRLLDAVEDQPADTAPVADPDTAMGWLRDMRRLWRSMDDQGRRDLAAAIYERITVTSERIVEVELTQEAQRHGAALALPEWVLVARVEGVEPPTL